MPHLLGADDTGAGLSQSALDPVGEFGRDLLGGIERGLDILDQLPRMTRNKIVDAAEAVAIIRSGDTVASSGFVGVGTPDEIIKALELRFVQTGEPRDLSLVFAAAPGDGADRGLNRLAHPGLIKRLVGGHFGLVPKLARMAVDNHVEAYNLPLGCVSQLFREIAGRKAGLLSKVGLGTFVDPANARGVRGGFHEGRLFL